METDKSESCPVCGREMETISDCHHYEYYCPSCLMVYVLLDSYV